jgi:CRISPR-associated protein Csm4
MQAILLIPESGAQFHLGERELDDTSDILHADTLFSALANVYEMALSGAGTIIDLMKSGKLRFSSGFYALQYNKQSLFFLPKPPVEYSGATDQKKLKQVKYISLGVWKKFLECFDYQNPEKPKSSLDLLAMPTIGGEFVYTEDELTCFDEKLNHKVFRSQQTVPKVKVHTTDKDDCLYHETTVQFTPMHLKSGTVCGAFYFFLEYDDLTPDEWSEFMAALRIMADEGVGGQRSSGRGQFASVELVENVDLPSFQNPAFYLGLSLISPANNDEFHNGLHRYELMIRGGGSLGKMGLAEQHRKQAKFVREGALLRQNINGQFVDVSPEHNDTILRNGFNFAIPIGTPV